MKRRIVIALLVLSAFGAGFILGDRSWKRIQIFFGPTVIVPNVPSHLGYFRLAHLPPFCSDPYFFREGFRDVDEYLSFVLPPDRAREFLAAYVKENELPATEDPAAIPRWVLGMPGQEKWDGRYWFGSFSELDEIYYVKHLFVGYSASRNRIYLMNWND